MDPTGGARRSLAQGDVPEELQVPVVVLLPVSVQIEQEVQPPEHPQPSIEVEVGVQLEVTAARLAEKEVQEETLKRLKTEAELEALRAKVNPHFLFNTLNSIASLIPEDPERAESTVQLLSNMFHYALFSSEHDLVPLGKELDFVGQYLQIEKVRFGDRLVIDKSIEARAQNALVPSLVLQPLIENAIKYAITPFEEGGTLRISARVQQQTLVLQLSDTGPGLGNGNNGQKSTGVGLKNTRERLQQLYGDNQAFTLAPNEPTGLRITINIPYEVEDD